MKTKMTDIGHYLPLEYQPPYGTSLNRIRLSTLMAFRTLLILLPKLMAIGKLSPPTKTVNP